MKSVNRAREIREVKIRVTILRSAETGAASMYEARRVLDSLTDAEVDAEYGMLPRMIRVRPYLDRYKAMCPWAQRVALDLDADWIKRAGELRRKKEGEER